MAQEAIKPRLGRGLAALIGDAGDESNIMERARGQRRVPVEFLRPNPRNPRKTFKEYDLDFLAGSIRQRGIIQPIVVRDGGAPNAYEIIAGERRWRAAQKAGLHDVPIVIVEADDRTSLEYAIIENVQRTDLNPIEEAAGYERLMSEFGYTPGDLGGARGANDDRLDDAALADRAGQEVEVVLLEGLARVARIGVQELDRHAPLAAAGPLHDGGFVRRVADQGGEAAAEAGSQGFLGHRIVPLERPHAAFSALSRWMTSDASRR